MCWLLYMSRMSASLLLVWFFLVLSENVRWCGKRVEQLRRLSRYHTKTTCDNFIARSATTDEKSLNNQNWSVDGAGSYEIYRKMYFISSCTIKSGFWIDMQSIQVKIPLQLLIDMSNLKFSRFFTTQSPRYHSTTIDRHFDVTSMKRESLENELLISSSFSSDWIVNF